MFTKQAFKHLVSFESEVYFQRNLADKFTPKENVVGTTTKCLHNDITETMFDIGKFSFPARLLFRNMSSEVTVQRTLKGTPSYSSKNMFNWLIQILRSPVVNSYGMLKPSAPNFLLSSVTPWKRHREKSRNLNSSWMGNNTMIFLRNKNCDVVSI